jgi:hypothetical protein
MTSSRTVFAELMTHVSQSKFQTCVARYDGDYKSSRFSCWDQYLCMAFAQLTYRESLRDIEACLRAVQSRLYHVGIRARVARSTLAEANEARDWRIYADFTQGLIRTARDLYVDESLAVDLANTVYALDATIIDLCLSVFPWAHYRRRDAAVKLHTQVDLRGLIPTVVQITEGKRADVTFLDNLAIEPGAIYIMDRGYVDFERLHRFTQEAAFFVTRTKKGSDCLPGESSGDGPFHARDFGQDRFTVAIPLYKFREVRYRVAQQRWPSPRRSIRLPSSTT